MEAALEKFREKSDVIIAIGIVSIILIMIVPLNAFLMDIFITISISLSLLILFISMYIKRPLDFSVFPSILLIVTLFRLSLNIASTRLILLKGDEGAGSAGRIIEAFGGFIVGGNYVVGAVVFLILIIINFVVITKGAGRVAEVAARFTLDAMPGKQMSIDADLNAGLIDDKSARIRRERVEMEADFYGAMDGSSKFVRGDAIAGIIVIFVNIIGGLVIGVVQKGMAAMDALSVYTLLTIGDGLVSQIPSLLTSTAAGIIVTRAASEKNLGRDVMSQLFTQPKALVLAAIIIMSIGFVPGVPLVPFAMLASVTFGAGYVINKKNVADALAATQATDALEAAEAKAEEKTEVVHPVEVFELEIGYGLISVVDVDQGGELLDKIRAMRKQIAAELGIVVPPMKLRDNLHLESNEYCIVLKGIEVAKGKLMPGYLLAMGPEDKQQELGGMPTKEPVFGLDAIWVTGEKKEMCQAHGCTVVDTATIIATHLTEVVRANAHEFITRQEMQKLIDTVMQTNPKVLEEIAQTQLSLGVVQKIIQNLLREQVSIRDLVTILEAVADVSAITKDAENITEYVRQKIARNILKPYLVDGVLNVLILEKQVEEKILGSLQQTEQGPQLALDLNLSQQLIYKIGEEARRILTLDVQPVLLIHPAVRAKLRKLLERYNVNVAVISHNEIPAQVSVQSAGVIKI